MLRRVCFCSGWLILMTTAMLSAQSSPPPSLFPEKIQDEITPVPSPTPKSKSAPRRARKDYNPRGLRALTRRPAFRDQPSPEEPPLLTTPLLPGSIREPVTEELPPLRTVGEPQEEGSEFAIEVEKSWTSPVSMRPKSVTPPAPIVELKPIAISSMKASAPPVQPTVDREEPLPTTLVHEKVTESSRRTETDHSVGVQPGQFAVERTGQPSFPTSTLGKPIARSGVPRLLPGEETLKRAGGNLKPVTEPLRRVKAEIVTPAPAPIAKRNPVPTAGRSTSLLRRKIALRCGRWVKSVTIVPQAHEHLFVLVRAHAKWQIREVERRLSKMPELQTQSIQYEVRSEQ